MDTDSDKTTGKAESSPKRGRPRKVSKKALMAAISGSMGIRHVILRELQISSTTLDKYFEIYPVVKTAFQDERDIWENECRAMAETHLYKAVERGEPWAVMFVLSTIGDYSQKYEYIGNGFASPMMESDSKVTGKMLPLADN